MQLADPPLDSTSQGVRGGGGPRLTVGGQWAVAPTLSWLATPTQPCVIPGLPLGTVSWPCPEPGHPTLELEATPRTAYGTTLAYALRYIRA
jgi:hypothetical protein